MQINFSHKQHKCHTMHSSKRITGNPEAQGISLQSIYHPGLSIFPWRRWQHIREETQSSAELSISEQAGAPGPQEHHPKRQTGANGPSW